MINRFKNSILLLGLIFCFVSLGYAENTQEVPTIGQIVWVKGAMKAISSKSLGRTLKRADYIYEQDTLVTDKTGSGQITFTDGSLMTLREDTVLKMSEYKYKKDAKPKEDKNIMELAKGGFRTISGAIAKNNPEGYAAKTPVATIGIRGTDYSVYYRNQLFVQINRGIIDVANKGGTISLDPQRQSSAQINSINARPIPLKIPPAIFKSQPGIIPTAPAPIKMTPPPSGVPMATPTPSSSSSGVPMATPTPSSSETSNNAAAAAAVTSAGTGGGPSSTPPPTSGGGGGGGGGGSCKAPVKAGAPTTGAPSVNSTVVIGKP